MFKFLCCLLKKHQLNFIKNEVGAVILLYGLALLPLFGIIGLAIDGGRIFYVNAVISGAVDSASVAGAKAGGTNANIIQNATAVFNANIPNNFIGQITGPTVSITVDSQNHQIVTVTASAQINTAFMSLFNQNNISTNSSSAALVATPVTEIALVLDNTGSMYGAPMQGVINASKELVRIVYGGVDVIPNLYFSVVPFSTTVNINMPGFDPTSWLTAAGRLQVANTNLYPNIAPNATNVGGRWMGCIEARTSPLDANDTTPSGGLFTPFHYPSTLIHKYVYGQPLDRTNPLGSPPWSSTGRRGDNDWTLAGGVPAGSGLRFGDNYNWSLTDGNLGVGPNLGCPIPILPLTESQTTVQATLSNMKASFRGGTMINMGLVAGWWTISPNWRGLWPSPTPASEPQPYANARKFVVLMTDGVNQWYDWPGGVPGVPSLSPPNFTNQAQIATDADYTAYGRLGEGRLAGNTNFAQTTTILNNRMAGMCTTLKNNGVVIYTILFYHGGGQNPATETLFRNCATDPGKYFFAVTNAQLLTAFQNIANSIKSIRLAWPGNP
jgi:Flp pilus assembly protein TadG